MRKKRQFKAGRCYHQGSRVAHRAFTFDGAKTYTYDYHVDGQLARADYGNGKTEDFGWDGLALIKRGDERFVNEPHVGGGNPVASSKGTKYFNDMLGTTVGAKTKGRKYTPAALTAFGETIENGGVRSTPKPSTYTSFFTGKPHVAGLGHAFLFRNYRASLAKWQTADPLGYPDGWNQLAYCGNGVADAVDLWGCKTSKRQDPNYERTWDKQLSGWYFDHYDQNGNKVYYSIWEIYTETKWDFYDIVPDQKTELEKWISYAKTGTEFTGMAGGVVVSIIGLATGGTAYLVGGVAVSGAAFLAYLLDNDDERTVEKYLTSTYETSTKREKRYKTVPE